MIKFGRDNTSVKVYVEHGLFGTSECFTLNIHQDHPYQAELLRNQLQENLNKHIKSIKEKAYNDGWADAKAKRKKKNWSEFWGGWK